MGTRYEVGDIVRFKNHPRKSEVVDINEPDSDSPTYVVEDMTSDGEFEYAKASELQKVDRGSGWKQTAKRELENHLDVRTEKMNTHFQLRDSGSKGFSLRTVDGEKGSNGEREWMVLKDRSAAKEAAISEVMNNLEQRPQTFNDSFLYNYLYISDPDRRMLADEEARDTVRMKLDDMSRKEVKRKAKNRGISAPSNYHRDDQIYNYMRQELSEQMEMEMKKEIEKELENPIEYFVKEKGIYSKETLLDQDFIRIEKEEAAEQAVRADGEAHFLDHYDGKGIELPSGAVAFGTN